MGARSCERQQLKSGITSRPRSGNRVLADHLTDWRCRGMDADAGFRNLLTCFDDADQRDRCGADLSRKACYVVELAGPLH